MMDSPLRPTLSVKRVRDEEYETKFFGFSSHDVFDGVKERIVPDAIVVSAESLKACLMQNFKKESQLQQIETATLELTKESKMAAAGPLLQLKTILDEHFKIPFNILLQEDSVQYNQYDNIENIDQEWKDLKDRAKLACYMENFLQDEISVLEKFDGSVTDNFMLKDVERALSKQPSEAFGFENLPSTVIKLAQDVQNLHKVKCKYLKGNASIDISDESLRKKYLLQTNKSS